MSVEIIYDGKVIAEAQHGTTKILECAGKEMDGNVAVIVPDLQEKKVAANGLVEPDEGYDGLSKVTVSVPVPSGYVKPSGTLSITENGTYDVKYRASAEVNVQPTLQEKTVTENGEVTPDEGYDGLSRVVVNVADSPLPIEVSTEAEMTALLESGKIGGVYKYTGTTGTYVNGSLYVIEASE